MPPAWPDDDYLVLLGKVTYSVAAIEGLLIFDLPRLPGSPEGAEPSKVAGESTRGVGLYLSKLADTIDDDEWAAYLRRGGEALIDIAPRRNGVLHARPATLEVGDRRLQCLYRWRPPEVYWVDAEHLAQLLSLIDGHRDELHQLRPPL